MTPMSRPARRPAHRFWFRFALLGITLSLFPWLLLLTVGLALGD